jgi:2-methylcitrate dehydratase PrpD
MNELKQLAAFVAETTFDGLPPEVIERAKWVLRDTVGVILGGMAEPAVQALADYAFSQGPGPATLFGYGPRQVTPGWAVLVHGTAGTSLEMDEGHAFARGHAAIHTVPPALALAEARQTGGQEALTALVVGYEVAARAGVATRLRPGVHPFGAWGVLGAAAIGARFNGLDAEGVAGAMEVAASYAITPSFNTAYQGANVRDTYAGLVNQLGLLAADLYPLGFRGEQGGLKTAFGQILGTSFEPAALADGLGERYEIMRGYFKPYSACRYTHATVDALLALMSAADIEVPNIEAIEVATYDIAATLTESRPRTPLAGRFSLPHVVAACLTLGSAGPEAFAPEVLDDPDIRSLASRVTVVEAPEFTAMTPAKRPARVTIRFADGSQQEMTVTGSKGDPDQPLSATELEAKFHGLADPRLGHEPASQIWHQLGHLERVSNLTNLAELLRIIGDEEMRK